MIVRHGEDPVPTSQRYLKERKDDIEGIMKLIRRCKDSTLDPTGLFQNLDELFPETPRTEFRKVDEMLPEKPRPFFSNFGLDGLLPKPAKHNGKEDIDDPKGDQITQESNRRVQDDRPDGL